MLAKNVLFVVFSVRTSVAYTVRGDVMEMMTVKIALDRSVQMKRTVRPLYDQRHRLQL
jgi:hypothetical protein